MSAEPEHVERLREIIAEQRSVGRRLETLLHEMSRGTANADGPCVMCGGKGVRLEGGYSSDGGMPVSVPCNCTAGLPFRNAAAAQGRKRPHDEPAPRFLPNDAPRTSGRDKAIGND